MRSIKLACSLIFMTVIPAYAAISPQHTDTQGVTLQQLSGFFRVSFDNLSMPHNDQSMGLVGVDYFAHLTEHIYGGISGYASVTGTQGGMFILGLGAGYHQEFAKHWWIDGGMFAGGGGGKSSLVGGGLMLRPNLGIQYEFSWARLGLHYSYIDFPTGKIHSQQIGLDLDIPADFYYLNPGQTSYSSLTLENFHLPCNRYLDFQRNDFAILLQAYYQKPGLVNTNGVVQDGRVGLVGFEFDHYFMGNTFWWLKASGAFSGIPHGYMDVLGGLGYHWAGPYGIALIPQLGAGAGGGGMVDTGGGFLVNPLLGVEVPLTSHFAARLSSGYLWAPKGDFQAVPVTAELLYHLDFATGSDTPVQKLIKQVDVHEWRFQIFNQSYFHPQRNSYSTEAPINLLAMQIDQIFTPIFFMSYQGAFAYEGFHAGGLATGMIGPGIQTKKYIYDHVQFFTELLAGAGGGGNLAMGGGALYEPMVGLRYDFNPNVGLQASASQIQSFNDRLSTPALNLGVTFSFDTLNKM